MLSFSRNYHFWPQFSYGRKLWFRPKCSLSAAIPLSAAILLRPKVAVTAAIRLSSFSRITVEAVRQKNPFGRSLCTQDQPCGHNIGKSLGDMALMRSIQ